MWRTFSREGVPLTVVTDNGDTLYIKRSARLIGKTVGCRQVFTAPLHPASNGLAENFMKTLKNVVRAMNPTFFRNCEQCIDSFLLKKPEC